MVEMFEAQVVTQRSDRLFSDIHLVCVQAYDLRLAYGQVWRQARVITTGSVSEGSRRMRR
jgi:hypothetical protein